MTDVEGLRTPETSQSDAQLLAAVARDDWSAFEILYSRYHRRIAFFACRYLGEWAAAEDTAQEVFLNVYRSAWRFREMEGACAAAWIFKIAYHVSLNELKRRSRTMRKLQDLWFWRQQDPEGGTTGHAAPDGDLEREVRQAVGRLPAAQRAAIVLRVNEGLSYAQIGQIMNKSVSSVESLIFRARTALKKLLQD